jgi:hypothetical protein
MSDAGTDFVRACHSLKRIHEALRYKRPGFVDYCQSKPGLSNGTAYRMIDVAKMFPNLGNIQSGPSALYLLASPSTPESARQEAIERAGQGETITHQSARDIVSNHRNPPIPFTPDTNGWHNQRLRDNEELGLENIIDETTGKLIDIQPKMITPADADDGASRMKPKVNRAGDTETANAFDSCQTPAHAIDPLLPYLPIDWTIWEPACGEGMLVDAFYDADRAVIGSDIINGDNFFTCDGPDIWDCLITNPPYSIKYQWLERCYQLERPFALLLPVETLGAQRAQRLFVEYGVQIIFLDKRINFKMPNKGWDGGGAQFPVAWFTWGLNLETQIVFARLNP